MRARWSTQTSTSMGSSETEVKALAVMPWTSSSESRVMTVMPVAKQAKALRNSSGLTVMGRHSRARNRLADRIPYHVGQQRRLSGEGQGGREEQGNLCFHV